MLPTRLRTLRGLALMLLLGSSLAARQQSTTSKEVSDDPPGAEGALSNDCFLPTDARAQELLTDGQLALEQARGAGAADAGRYYNECIDAWHGALLEAPAAASIWVRSRGAEERTLSEGLRYGLLRRLGQLSDAERLLWTQRVGALAQPALAAAGRSPRALKQLTRSFPLTQEACRAGILLADMALERGAYAEASRRLQRARAELPGSAGGPGLKAAIERRLGSLPEPQPGSSWDQATGFDWVSAEAIGPPQRQRSTGISARSARMRGVRPGLVRLPESRLAVQTPGLVNLFRLDHDSILHPERSFTSPRLGFPNGRELPFGMPQVDPRRARRAPGWQLVPAAAGNELFLVVGQSTPEGLSNALIAVGLPAPLLPGSRDLPGQVPPPTIQWAVLGNEWADREGELHRIERLSGLVDLEFQPGPVVLENRVLVHARSYGDVISSWLICFDRHSGQLQWRHLLGTGADLLGEHGRLGAGSAPRLSAPPMTLVDDSASPSKRLFIGTNLGFCVLVDAIDGRPLWSFKYRRRDVDELGWDGYAAPLGRSPSPHIALAPFDSDRLYRLRLGPLAGAAPGRAELQLGRPLPIGESRTLLSSDARSVVVQGHAGHERTVSELAMDPMRGSMRTDSLYLGPGEEFLGRGLVGEQHVLVCSERGLYLFDRARELYLLGYAALPASLGSRKLSPGGDLYALGDHILALGKNGIWSFKAR